MVWCARESLDYASSQAMVCDWHYGWIHWDPLTQSWHSVTNVQLSMPRPPTAEQVAAAAQTAARDAQAAAARAVEAARAAEDAQAAGDQQAVAAQVAAAAEAAAEVYAAAERAAEAANAAPGDAPPPGAAPPLEPGKDITPIYQQILLPEIFRTSNPDIPSLRKVAE
jgi:hypothetical protein